MGYHTIVAMPDDNYRTLVDDDTLPYVDHREVLKVMLAGYPLATTSAQARIMIEYLEKVEARMKAAGK